VSNTLTPAQMNKIKPFIIDGSASDLIVDIQCVDYKPIGIDVGVWGHSTGQHMLTLSDKEAKALGTWLLNTADKVKRYNKTAKGRGV
jgi:hypothetical protein